MVREDGKRNFVLREEDDTETSVFSGSIPGQAALKAAQRLDPAGPEDDTKSDAVKIRLREKETDRVHIFDAWAWNSSVPEDKPGWMGGEIIKGNVSKKGVEHLDE